MKGLSISGKGAGPYSKIIAAGILLLLIGVLFIWLLYLPYANEIRQKKQKINKLNSMRNELVQVRKRIKKANKDLGKAKVRYDKLTRLFHTDQELEELYRQISLLSLKHNLQVMKLERGREEPVYDKKTKAKQKRDKKKPDPSKALYVKVVVECEIVGRYPDYINFSSDLGKLKKMVNIENQEIKINDNTKTLGMVTIKITLSTYRLLTGEAKMAAS